jgi:hypothetical protein
MNSPQITVLVGIALLAIPVFGRDRTDVLIMKNGDRMTCEVKGLNAGVLYVSFDYIDGTTAVDWSKVVRLESTQLFVVKTESGSVYTGTLDTTETGPGRPVKIRVLEALEKVAEINRSQIVKMVGTSDKFWERFNGAISLGVIYSKGNQSTQYSLGSEAAYVRERWGAQAGFESNLSSSAGVNTSTRNSLDLGAFHLLPSKSWFYSAVAEFLQSSEQGISLQSTLGGGIGRYFRNTNRMSISIVGGAAWQRTRYQQSLIPLNQQNLGAALITAEAQFFRFSKTSLNTKLALLPAISDPGRIRVNTNASFYVKLFGDLKWNASFYGNWDNRPPPGFSGSDYGTSSGLAWTFGLR